MCYRTRVLSRYLDPLVNGLPDLRALWLDVVEYYHGRGLELRAWPITPSSMNGLEPWYAELPRASGPFINHRKRILRAPAKLIGFRIFHNGDPPAKSGISGFLPYFTVSTQAIRMLLLGKVERVSWTDLPCAGEIDYCKMFLQEARNA